MGANQIDYTKTLELLQKRNDPNALIELYKASRERLFALAFTILQNEESAKDLVQDFFIDFWENELFHRIKGSLKNYMARSIWNRAINYKKQHGRLYQLNIDLDADSSAETRFPLENEQLTAEISSAINKLPPMVKRVFQLHYLDQYSYVEISHQLGITKPTISKHMDKALKRLRSDLRKSYKK